MRLQRLDKCRGRSPTASVSACVPYNPICLCKRMCAIQPYL